MGAALLGTSELSILKFGLLTDTEPWKPVWIKDVFPNLKDKILCFCLNICDVSASNDGNFIKQMIFEMPNLRSRELIMYVTLAYNSMRKACQNKIIWTLNSDSLSHPSPSFCSRTMTSLFLFNLSFMPLSQAKSSNKLWKWGKTGVRDGGWRCMSKVSSLL